MAEEWQRGEYTISTDKSRLDLPAIQAFLRTAYWSQNIPFAIVERAIENSMVFGLYKATQQAGMARVITDRATFAYISDVFVLEPHRGLGLGVWLMQVVRSHPDLQGLRRMLLATRDAHTLYQKAGFTPLNAPDRFMEVWDPQVYERSGS